MNSLDIQLLVWLYSWALGIGLPVLALTWYFERKKK